MDIHSLSISWLAMTQTSLLYNVLSFGEETEVAEADQGTFIL